MLGGTVINIEILVGLPGSGKTYYANKKEFEYKRYYPCNSYYAKVTGQRQVNTVIFT